MRAFAYTAFTASGGRKSGTILAETEPHAADLLKGQGLFVAELSAQVERQRGASLFARRLNADLRAVFTRQMAVLLGAGLPADAALDAVRSTGGGPMETLATRARAALMEGAPLSNAIAAAQMGFPPFYIAAIRAAETSGDSATVLAELADYLETARGDRAQIATALIYPLFVAAVSLLVCGILMTTVAPEIVAMFALSDRPLPPLTQAMLAATDWIARFWPVLAAIVLGLVALLVAATRFPALRDRRDALILRLPLFGRLTRLSAAVQYLRTLALVLTSKHAVLVGVESAAQVLTIRHFRDEGTDVATAIRQGESLSDALRSLSIVPSVARQLIAAGERSANLARMSDRAAQLCENTLTTERKRIAALLEPMLMIVVGAGVLVIVLSVLLPIFDLQGVVAG